MRLFSDYRTERKKIGTRIDVSDIIEAKAGILKTRLLFLPA